MDDGYFESEEFASRFMNAINNEIRSTIYNDDTYMINNDGMRVYHAYKMRNEFSDLKNSYFIVHYIPRNKIYTNLNNFDETQPLGTLIDYVMKRNGEKFYSYGGKVETSSNILSENWENYKSMFSGDFYYSDGEYYVTAKDAIDEVDVKIESSITDTESAKLYIKEAEEAGIVYDQYSIDDFMIYVTYEKGFCLDSNDAYMINILKTLQPYENELYVAVPVCGFLTVIIFWYLILAIGHEKNQKEIQLNDIDRIPLEIVFTILFIMSSLILIVTSNGVYSGGDYYKLFLSEIITGYLVMYVLCAITFVSCVKRIKAKSFFKNTIIWRVLKLIKRLWNGLKTKFSVLTERFPITLKFISVILAYILIMLCVLFICRGEMSLGIFIDVLILNYAFYQVIKRVNLLKRIEDKLKDIYEGNHKEKLMENEFTDEFKNAIQYINDISNGLEVAVEDRIKSERLKTELITNVSHDIKTPLTSIINYVDLIKREDIKDEKIKEYIEILESKAFRLKRLTEDLVEASKASSGNVKLNLEILNLVELINQITGEFEDKFQEKQLEVIKTIPEEEITILADSRYMYRIVENVFSNVAKYALKGSRVYVDIRHDENKVKVEVKNVSEEKLNITEEELMQRFVRGDKSRTTEGSGLGLSISKSLAELQHGSFNICIDGDLFKVQMQFDIAAHENADITE